MFWLSSASLFDKPPASKSSRQLYSTICRNTTQLFTHGFSHFISDCFTQGCLHEIIYIVYIKLAHYWPTMKRRLSVLGKGGAWASTCYYSVACCLDVMLWVSWLFLFYWCEDRYFVPSPLRPWKLILWKRCECAVMPLCAWQVLFVVLLLLESWASAQRWAVVRGTRATS
jgi:hypothetical protein